MLTWLHIGLPGCGAGAIQTVLDDRRNHLKGKGVLFPRSCGPRNHTRLYMAMTDPDHVDLLRWNRGHGPEQAQTNLRRKVADDLKRDIDKVQPDVLILSAEQFGGSLFRTSELERLKAFIGEFSDDIRIVAHVDEQARVLARHYAQQVMEGRSTSLNNELKLAKGPDWRESCLAGWQDIDPVRHQFPELQAAPFWLDYAALQGAWEQVFGQGSLHFRGYDQALFRSNALLEEIRESFDLGISLGKLEPSKIANEPSAAWLARGRAVNTMLRQTLDAGRIIPRPRWRKMMRRLKIGGPPLDPGSLSTVSRHFKTANTALLKKHQALDATCLKSPKKSANWTEADPERGFRASQYMTVFLPEIDAYSVKTIAETQAAKPVTPKKPAPATRDEPKNLPPLAVANYHKLKGGRFAPHNNTGRVNEEELAAQFPVIEPRELPKGNSGTVIVGCMKNEAPYIVEWVAYHRSIGVDNFLIYTNGCEDGTSELLDHLQDMGLVEHRNNDNWKGNSPQQHALNKSLKEPLIKTAEWIIHIDVDEFINVRCGNGTLPAFLERVPDATNIAMTWRLFGHNGVTRFEDRPVIEQFDTCAPKHCPKPHTVWGFKTMFKNIGAYDKISCHRPNKLRPGKANKVHWVNGSGQPMGAEVKEKGWRSGIKTIGYDLIQLNHYALRSAESFLIKRQRGRALHVDRTIGLNYWVRMDWSHNKDVTIQRNLGRLSQEMWRLLEDEKLAKLHQSGVDWHRAKAAELHQKPEFQELYAGALDTNLTEMERVAYALALDMES